MSWQRSSWQSSGSNWTRAVIPTTVLITVHPSSHAHSWCRCTTWVSMFRQNGTVTWTLASASASYREAASAYCLEAA